MKIRALTFFLLLPLFTYSQADISPFIEAIRKGYYYTNGEKVSLNRLVIQGREYFFEGEELKKVVVKQENITREYYFDKTLAEGAPYFIYTIEYQGESGLENRYYYSPEKELIRWIDDTGAKHEAGMHSAQDYCQTGLLQLILAEDLQILLKNHQLHGVDQVEMGRIYAWEARLEKVDKYPWEEKVLKDRTDDSEGFYFEKEIEYRRSDGSLAKTMSEEGGDHGGNSSSSYYNEKGEVWATVETRYSFYQGTEKILNILQEGHSVRKIRYRSTGYNPACPLEVEHNFPGEIIE